jgi:hypothetical protein
MAAAMTSAGAVDVPDLEVVKVAMSVLARKLRSEMMLGLLEEFAAGQRTGRSMLAEFREAEATLLSRRGDHESLAVHALDGLVRQAGSGAERGGQSTDTRWFEGIRNTASGGTPAWERLRQNGRDRGRPVEAWEIFHGLHSLAAQQARADGPPDRDIGIHHIESAMQLEGGLGADWSLHRALREAREKLGAEFRPAPASDVAAMLLRVDGARQLLKPGGFTIGIRPGPAAPARAIDESTMRDLESNIRDTMVRQMSAAAALDMVRNPGSATRGTRPVDADVDQALVAGAAIVQARRAREVADRARQRATELRGERLGSHSTLFFATSAMMGVGMTSVSLAGDTKMQLTAVIGLTMTTLAATGNTIKDWKPHAAAIAAPFRAWVAERVAEGAQHLANREVARLDGGGSSQAMTAWQRAQTALGAVQKGVLRHAVRTLDPQSPQGVAGRKPAQVPQQQQAPHRRA